METLIVPFFNVISLLAILFVFLKKPLAEFALNRQQMVRDELRTAREALLSAEKEREDVFRRLATIESELDQLRAGAREEGGKIRAGVRDSAWALSESIVADAVAAVRSLQEEFCEEIRRECADRALSRAEARLRDRLTEEDRERIRGEFSALMEKV